MKLQSKEVILLHTNDIHSHLNNLAKVETLISHYRESYAKDELVLVDLGDFMDRMATETEGTDGYIHRELFEYMQYDVVTLGNNEGLSFSHDQLTAVYQKPTSFQVVCCNMTPLDGSKLSWLLKSTIIEKNGLKLGFIGATIHYTDFYKLLNWDATEPLSAIQEEVNKIKAQVDVIIVMSHLGIRLDEELAERCPEIDIILGAHTHHVFNPAIMKEKTLMAAAGMGGSYLGVVHIKKQDPNADLYIEGRVLSTHDVAEDNDVLDIIARHRQVALNQLNKPIVRLDHDLVADDFVESPLPNLLAISLREWCRTSLAIVNSGQILHSLDKGIVRVKHLHEICPSPINPCVFYIKGCYIREAFEQSVLYEYRAKKIKGYGFRGTRLGYLAVAGFSIDYETPELLINSNKFNIYVNNVPLKDDEVYRVASIDMFTFKQGYPSLSQVEKVEYFVPEYIRHLLASTIMNKSLIEESKQCHWNNLPLD